MTWKLKLRQADESDVELLFHWRNDPLSIKNSFVERAVNWNEHRIWFNGSKGPIFICELTKQVGVWEDEACGYGGMFRVDPVDFGACGYSAEASWIVAPPFRGQGIGKVMLNEGLKMLRNITVAAKIKKENEASIAIAQKNGFEFKQELLKGVNLYLHKPVGI